ncbi:tetratricopeptide repeat protein [Polyangium jinanense]|uniref:Tetratricopeptide repeat protein n=1 Tax=Polyangium jinanense TaxID=2829994 RepID=A0A9X3X1Y2_9BACT|nr:tetratricopeptide repeat protein [Polyangium jinanense]MDC3954920.1 tetratricopeptide repeat protein [Polyangium jinanense]MDC3981310.1 tetratricopeptide repeat protein [Polyangium jinanense]
MLLLLDVMTRAARLFLLALAPPLLSPEPSPPGNPIVAAILAVLLLGAVLYGAVRLRAWGARERGFAWSASLAWVAVAAALGAALYFREGRAPLGQGVVFVAVPAWASITLAASTLAAKMFPRARHARRFAALAVLTASALVFASASSWLASPTQMWWEALRRDGEHPRAIGELTRKPLGSRDFLAARALADECLRLHPGSCRCQGERAEIAIRARDFVQALELARAAHETCPGDGALRALHAEALGLSGQAMRAEEEARRALALGGSEARLRYALALALAGQGKDTEAMREAKRAVELGAGRSAALFVGSSALVKGDLDEAARVLGPLVVADPGDAEAQYDLGLVADRRGDYNAARSAYLAALRADPSFADARYNLALLTFRRGVVDEAKHHAQKLREAHPNDPRSAELARSLGLQ